MIEQASLYISKREGKERPVFGGPKIESLPPAERRTRAAQIAPTLRGLCSAYQRMIGHFTDDERVLQFINSQDLSRLAPLGTSCPDHFLRTKIQPLVLDLPADIDLSDTNQVKAQLEPAFDQYRKEYAAYYESCKRANSPAMRDPNPVVILYPGVGMLTFAKNKQTARVASEFYINAINVMRGAEAITEYTALSRQEAFDIEYWLLEEAKLQRMPKEKPLSRKVALITGAGGGIGKAIADKLAAEGANIVLRDIVEDRLEVVSTVGGLEHAAPGRRHHGGSRGRPRSTARAGARPRRQGRYLGARSRGRGGPLVVGPAGCRRAGRDRARKAACFRGRIARSRAHSGSTWKDLLRTVDGDTP